MDVNFILGISALIVGFVALFVALPPFLQMIYGGPKVRIKFDATVEQNTTFLICNIYNVPIRSRFLKALGVTRSATEVFASFDVREHGTNKIVANSFRAC